MEKFKVLKVNFQVSGFRPQKSLSVAQGGDFDVLGPGMAEGRRAGVEC